MAKSVYKIILQDLCNNQGSLDFRTLKEHISQHFTVDEELLRSVLFDDEKIHIQEGKGKISSGEVSLDSLIIAKTSLRLCRDKTCQECDKLHLCRYYVCGNCTFGDKCKNPHSVTSPHNARILAKCELKDLTDKQLFQLLLQNDSFLLPEICFHYNKGEGDCSFGSKCKRAHTIDAQGMKLFKQYSKENITNLYLIYRNRLLIQDYQPRPAAVLPEVSCPTPVSPSKTMSPSKKMPPSKTAASPPKQTSRAPPAAKGVSDAARDEICLFFIRRNCSYNERCVRVHWHLPYKWEMKESDGTWKTMDDMENIEKAFCDPSKSTSCPDEVTTPSGIFRFLNLQSYSAPAVGSVDFIEMIKGASPVRRLSTASSVSHPPNHILTTQWLWYWKDEYGVWVEYGKADAGATASITSQTLENIYLAKINEEIEFTTGNQRYKLYFKGGHGLQMYQQNLKSNTKREVRRRPHFVSAHDVEAKLNSDGGSQSSASAYSVPPNWDPKALVDGGHKLVPLGGSTSEYSMIKKLFMPTMPESTITSIKRIQNPDLWRVFQWQKEQMKKRNGGKSVNEKHLFHGTDKGHVDAICDQNFDWRMCGVHGTAYGKGSYFARDASYSNKYSATGQRSKVMFVALVLVGDYTQGHSQYVRPPPKENSTTLYDSCVNSVTNPSIFVIFEKQQIYPEYLIEYI
uniref:Uncharacterized protein n=1 Tax=Knipowitschia caucasica TaxID=637954 RepID=A0AAV2L5S6_KNICA